MAETYGYMRVSARDQNEARQKAALLMYGIKLYNLYLDKQSGKDFDRPAYQRLLQKLQPGDLLIVKSIDRLGRNYEEILAEWRRITKDKAVDIMIVDMPLLDTRNSSDLMGLFIADLVLQILSFVAQNERENIKQRQAEGITAAKARGVHFGRRTIKAPEAFPQIVTAWEQKQLTFAQALSQSGMSEATFYRRLREYRTASRANQ